MADLTFSDIEEAIVTRLTTSLADAARRVDVQRGVSGIPQPAVYASVDAGEFMKVSQSTYKVQLKIYVDIIFKHLSSELERRKGIFLILKSIILSLMLQDLDLNISPLRPKSFSNTTTDELGEKGLISFSLELETGMTMTRVDDEVTVDLLRVGLNYYLQPDDDVVDASDLLTLQGD
jgi:hypothetical protein